MCLFLSFVFVLFVFVLRRLEAGDDRVPVGGLGRVALDRLRRRVIGAGVLEVAVDDIAARIHAELLGTNGHGIEVAELVHRVAGLLGLECRLGSGRGGRRLRNQLGNLGNDGLDLRLGGGNLLCRERRGALCVDGGLLLIGLGRGLLALLLGRAVRVARDGAGIRGSGRRHGGRRGSLLGARRNGRALPGLERLEHLRVRPRLIGLLLLEHSAELLDHGGRALKVLLVLLRRISARRLEQVADAHGELDPHIGLLLRRVRVLHLLCLLCRRGKVSAAADGRLEREELRLERGDGAEERRGVGDGRHFVWMLGKLKAESGRVISISNRTALWAKIGFNFSFWRRL